jgi:hypothetical protein
MSSIRLEHGMKENTLQLLQACQKGMHMDCLEAVFIQTFHQQEILMEEQNVNNMKPLFQLVQIKHTP